MRQSIAYRLLHMTRSLCQMAIAACTVLFGLAVSTTAVGQPSQYNFSTVTARANAYIASERLDGATLVIMRDQVEIHRQYFGSHNAQTQLDTASAAKWISATVIASVVQSGQLRWSSRVGDYFSGLGTEKSSITLEQLVSFTAGIDNVNDAPCLNNRTVTLDACAREVLSYPLIAVPGTAFVYGGNSFQVAGRMAEIATGKDWNVLFKERVADPLGMTRTDYAGFLSGSNTGFTAVSNPRLAGGMRTTVDDYAQLVKMHQRYGLSPQNSSILSADSIQTLDKLRTLGLRIIASPGEGLIKGYALGHWVYQTDSANREITLTSPGSYGLTPWVNRTLGYSAVWFVRGRAGLGTSFIGLVDEIDKAIAQATTANVTGTWWDPKASGFGLALSQQGTTGFSALYHYDNTGRSIWYYTPQLRVAADGSLSGDLQRTSRTNTGGSQISSQTIGTLSLGAPGSGKLVRNDASSAARTFEYTLNNQRYTTVLEPFVFVQPNYCYATTDTRIALPNLTEFWWDPAQSGQGVSVSHQGTTVFAALYTYNTTGEPVWLVAPNATKQSDGTYSGVLQRATSSGTQVQPSVQLTTVGSFELRIINGQSASLRYTADGVTVAQNLQRFDYSSPATACY